MKVRYRSMFPGDMQTIRKHMPFSASESMAGMVAYDQDRAKTLGMIIGQEFTKSSCMVHFVIDSPMVLRPKYGFFWHAGEWLFGKAGLKKLYALIPENNWRSLNVVEKIGFSEKARLEDGYDYGTDLILMELDRSECNFWQEPEMEKVSNG